MTVDLWDDLVLVECKPSPDNYLWQVIAIDHPDYKQPLLLGYTVRVKPRTLYQMYKDRWPIEQIPLAAKQMLGFHRQFVHAPESCQRLPELALLAGSILTYLAAIMPPIPTGFWDRHPAATPGRLRRVLAAMNFPFSYPLPERIREKAAVTAHLPKGHAAHQPSAEVATVHF